MDTSEWRRDLSGSDFATGQQLRRSPDQNIVANGDWREIQSHAAGANWRKRVWVETGSGADDHATADAHERSVEDHYPWRPIDEGAHMRAP